MSNRKPARIFHAECIAVANCKVGESPVWDPQSEAVYWVDIPNRRLLRVPAAGGALESWALPLTVSAFAMRSDGGFIAATNKGFAWLDFVVGEPVFTTGAGPELPEGWRMNDGACDRQGRFWAGTLSPTPAAPGAFGALYSLGPTENVIARGGEFRVQNGLSWSPDGHRMYVSDSHISHPHVMAYDFEPDTGERSNGTLLANHASLGGRPDGAAIDVDGCYWIAASDSGRVLRLTPSGKIDAEIIVGATNPTNICFGGNDMKTAYITTLHPDGGSGGDLYAVSLPFQGLAEPRYQSKA
ncbi:SMP-30/gluconolactonase/LRE family protein [Rhizobium sp.]|jgi:sugar lactone lactonase YvrE|uniref:SMP-30/gluconolactonase/LRE family protein n=1 Tax=Rhizobium sp. TaxID=391 RepID=UPI000E9FDFEE|nr:gluconolactonase [Rhizobium sp.]